MFKKKMENGILTTLVWDLGAGEGQKDKYKIHLLDLKVGLIIDKLSSRFIGLSYHIIIISDIIFFLTGGPGWDRNIKINLTGYCLL